MADYRSFPEMWEQLDRDPGFRAGLVKMAFTDQLAGIMAANGLRNSDLADRMGCSRAYVTKVFSGTTNFTLETMVTLASILGHRLEVRLVPTEGDDDSTFGVAVTEAGTAMD